MLQPLVTEWKKIGSELRPALPGLYLAVGVAVAARYIHGLIPNAAIARAVSEVFIAVLLGLHIRSAIHFSPRCDPGVKFALQRVLRLGIILLGLRLSLQDAVATGASALLLIVACMTFALGVAYAAGRLLRIPGRLAALIGVGTAVCGNTAIVAAAPVIEAQDEEISFAVAAITFFGTLAVIAYPIIGYATGMTDRSFGLWVGTAVNDTSQVVAAGAAFSEKARDIATVVKLTRNTLMAPLLLLLGVTYARAQNRRVAGRVKASIGKALPWFVFGFLAMTVLRTIGVAAGLFPHDVGSPGDLVAAANVLKFIDEIARFAVLVALSAIGLGTDIGAVRRIGLKPFAMALGLAASLALLAAAVTPLYLVG